MTVEPEDILLDACLEEVLGARTPPDLSARIMQALSAQGTNGKHVNGQVEPHKNGNGRTAADLLPPISAMRGAEWEPVPPPVAANQPVLLKQPSTNGAANHAKSRLSGRNISWLAVAAAIATIAVGVPASMYALRYLGGKPGDVVHSTPKDGKPEGGKSVATTSGKSDSSKNGTGTKKPGHPIRKPNNDPVAEKPDSGFGKSPFVENGNQDLDGAPSVARAKIPAEPDREIIAFVNSTLRQAWEEKGIKPAAAATDAEWCRRTYLRVVGRIPTVEELKKFTSSKSAERKSELVEQLTSGEGYRNEFARHWSEFFAGVLIGKGANAEGPASREGLLQYLQQAILSGKSYDRMAFDLLTATGSGQPGSSDYNGAANFLLANLNEKGVLATTRTSRVFLGKQLQCAQCHNHPSNEWGQHHFWELNAFFRQTRSERDRETGRVTLVNRDFRGEGGDPAEADVYYELPSGRLKVAYPIFPGTDPSAPTISHSGLVGEVDRRAELAKRVVASEDLARAAVNRLWGHFLGYGFTRPVDDMGSHNPPSHPQLLDRLAGQFAAHEYQLPDLMRWIVLSDAFSVSSKVGTDNLADAPEAGELPQFSRYYTRQMQPEQVYESLQIVAAARKNGNGDGELEKARLAWLGQFTREMGTDDGEEQSTFNGDIRQSIIMMNGPLTQRAISHDQGSILDRVSQSKLSFDEKVEHLFLAAVARKPTKVEHDVAADIHKRRGDVPSALQDIWWALLNSNEFILDH